MAKQPNGKQVATTDAADKIVAYVPLGETSEIELSINQVMKFIARPTKSGAMPSVQDVVSFIMLCRARQLNPWVADAYLIGYDGKNGPEFSLITAVQALHKRAEINEAYDGVEAGIIVERDGSTYEKDGAFRGSDERLLGAWAKVHRKDRSHPCYVSVNLGARDKQRSLWLSDPEGMIRKCAIAAAMREAFPSQCGGMYVREEVDGPVVLDAEPTRKQVTRSTLNDKIADAAEPEAAEPGKLFADSSEPELSSYHEAGA